MPTIGHSQFANDDYQGIFDNFDYDAWDDLGRAPPAIQDTGFTINFNNNHEGQSDKDLLRYLKKNGVPSTVPEIQDLERRLRKDKETDSMDVDFHGMKFNFKRDQHPSHWSAHIDNQQSAIYGDHFHYKHQHELLYNIMHILPFVIIGVAMFCLYLVIYCFIVYQCNKWIRYYTLKVQNKKYEFRGIPNIDPEDESDESDYNDPQIV